MRGAVDARDAVTGRAWCAGRTRAGWSRPRREGAQGEAGPRGGGPKGKGKKRRWVWVWFLFSWAGLSSFSYFFSISKTNQT